jgi:hypothetical protein
MIEDGYMARTPKVSGIWIYASRRAETFGFRLCGSIAAKLRLAKFQRRANRLTLYFAAQMKVCRIFSF